jgi:uncharacterized phage protein (TIGR02220 family)
LPKDAYYFSHDANARHDPKIIALRSVYGAEGYGWYWMIIEMMREQENYRLSLNSSRYTFQILSNQLQCTPEKAKQFIDDCIDEFGLFQSDGDSFWSESLVKRMEKMEELREIFSNAGKKGAKKRWGGHSHPTTTPMASDSNKRKEIKGKESKVNKGKEKIPSGVLVLKYLNKITNRSFQEVHKYTTARLKKYSIEDLARVILWKNHEWGANPEMRKFLRQETLFAPGHFDTYLTEAKEHENEVLMRQYEEYCRNLRSNYKGDKSKFKPPTYEEFITWQSQNLKNMNFLDQSKEDEKG